MRLHILQIHTVKLSLNQCDQMSGQIRLLHFPTALLLLVVRPSQYLDFIQHLQQFFPVYRFQNIICAVVTDRLSRILKICISAQDHKMCIGNLFPADFLQKFQSCDDRHFYIRNNEIYLLPAQIFQCFLSVCRRLNNFKSLLLPVNQYLQSL